MRSNFLSPFSTFRIFNWQAFLYEYLAAVVGSIGQGPFWRMAFAGVLDQYPLGLGVCM